jgi:hypothetical protein
MQHKPTKHHKQHKPTKLTCSAVKKAFPAASDCAVTNRWYNTPQNRLTKKKGPTIMKSTNANAHGTAVFLTGWASIPLASTAACITFTQP